MNKQQGFLSLAAVMIITVFALLSAIVIHLSLTTTSSTVHLQASNQTSLLAQSALEEGLYQLSQPSLNQRQTCTTLAATKSIANDSYQVRRATDTKNLVNPKIAAAQLTNLSSTTLSLTDSSLFAPSGRVMLNEEAIDYEYNNTARNRLEGINRAADNTPLTAPQRGNVVSQYQCTLEGTGRSPAESPDAISYQQITMQLTMIWAVGKRTLLWNYPAELTWSPTSSISELNAVSMVNYAVGFAVGKKQGNQVTIARWSLPSQAWQKQSTSLTTNNDLYGISAPSEREAWAVGESSDEKYYILRYQKGRFDNWCQLKTQQDSCGNIRLKSSANNDDKQLLAIDMADTNGDGLANVGFAVGSATKANKLSAQILVYNGRQWSEISNLPNDLGTLNGVKLIKCNLNTPVQAWAAGQSSDKKSGKILVWQGGNWQVAQTTPDPLLAIDMKDIDGNGRANFGWVVGTNGRAYYFNGARFQSFKLGNNDLNAVTIINENEAWIADSRGQRWHWDGQAWNIVGGSTQSLRGLANISANQRPQSGWRLATV